MAVERRDPLPVGLYWVDVPRTKWLRFSDWARHWGVIIRKTREDPDMLVTPENVWALFEVTNPSTRWVGIGLPTIASASTEPGDTRSRPDPASPLDYLPAFGSSAIGVLLLLMLLRK